LFNLDLKTTVIDRRFFMDQEIKKNLAATGI